MTNDEESWAVVCQEAGQWEIKEWTATKAMAVRGAKYLRTVKKGRRCRAATPEAAEKLTASNPRRPLFGDRRY